MNESNLWEWLRDVALPLGHYSRIESPDTAVGFPDVHYQIEFGVCGTIELKHSEGGLRPFPNQEKGLHRSQLKWIKDNTARWGYVWIIAEVPPNIFIINGTDADEFNGATQNELFDLCIGVVYRDNPKQAAKFLHNILTTWRYDK